MLIRKGTASDAVYLPDIERSAGRMFRQLPELAWIADDKVMSIADHLKFIDLQTSWIACDEKGSRCGFLCAEIADRAMHIWEISILMDYQRQGIGRALIDEAERCARLMDLRALTLTTFRSVPWNAPYYRRLGFAELMHDDMDARLRQILSEEADRGLLRSDRCAMVKPL